VKRVLLANANIALVPYPAPPIGISLVAAGVPEGFEVRVYDGAFDRGKGFEEILRDFDPDYIGIGIRNIDDMSMQGGSCFIGSMASAFASPARDRSRGKVILGGAGFSIFPVELMELFRADYGIVGEGEESFAALLGALEKGSGVRDIPGLVFRSGDAVAMTPRAVRPAGGLALKFSRIDRWIDYTPYVERGAYPVQTKRGCAHRCIYCTYPLIEGREYRLRSPSDVADEIEEAAVRLGPVTFEIVDSTFNGPPGHAEEVCREIARRKPKVRLRTMGVNPGGISDELLGLMKDAGFEQIDCTPDSASPAMLGSLGKNFNRRELEEAAELLRRRELPTMWFFIFGGPGETEKTLEESFDFIRRFVGGEDMVHMTEGLRIYPGTLLHKRAVEEGAAGKGEPLLEPRFYVSPRLGRERLGEILAGIGEELPNCMRSFESTPSRGMMEAAVKERRELGLKEPMFRTLLRLRRRGFR
jgi:radical SAM superfamily enzyme YgiQ (UPF0313 family)